MTTTLAACGTAAKPDPITPHHPLGYGWWHTSGTQVVDQLGRPLRIASVTWFGMESSDWVPAGLDYQPYTKIMDEVKRLGYNSIRLPFSNQVIEQNPIVTAHIGANPQFQGVHALQVLDAICSYAKKIGLKIILDDHRSIAAPPTRVSHLDEPLWYAPGYSQSAWIHDWQFLARRYPHNDAVIGFDLRNEPHTGPPGPWSLSTYLNQGSTWGPYNGKDNPNSDWRLAAEKAGNAVLAINPHLLMFVEGLQLYPDASQPYGVDKYWWAGILKPVAKYPVVFKVPHQLVYSPHEYGPEKVDFSWFHNMTYQSVVRVWNQMWGFIVDNPNASYAAPIWIGEVGTCTNLPTCIDDQQAGNQATWLHLFIRYLHDHPNVGFGIWALNGSNANNSPATNGILNHSWSGVQSWKLQRLWASVEH